MVNNECSSDQITEGPRHELLSSCPICQNPADKKCSACHNVSYCSAEHQKRHWKSHKHTCRSFTVKRNESYGRYLVATRDIPQGTIIFTEEPLTYGPKRGTLAVCLGCHKRVYEGCYRCSKCTYPMCSEDCEKAAIHAENECIVFQRAAHPVGSKISNFDSICPAYECITPLRCLMLKERNQSKWEKLVSMEHHNELRKSIPVLWNRNQVNVVKLLLEWYKMKDEFDEDTIHSVMGYIDVNCFEIKYSDIEICGVYRDGGLMCHECVPNTHNAITTTSDHKMIVRSSIPIKKGEMITTSYANRLSGTRERRYFLKDTKYFDCLCQRCQDPTEFATYISALKCTDCATGYLLPKDSLTVHSTDWACSNVSADEHHTTTNSSKSNGNSRCTKTLKDEQVQTILRKAKKDIDEVSRSTAGSQVSRLERLLKKYSGKILHPNYYVLLSVIKNLNYAYATMHGGGGVVAVDDGTTTDGKEELEMDRLMRSKSLYLQLLSVLDMIDPGLTRLRGKKNSANIICYMMTSYLLCFRSSIILNNFIMIVFMAATIGVTLFQMSLPDFQISRVKLQKNETSREEHKETVRNILAYLYTAREIMELDKVVVQNAILYGRIVEQTEILKESLASLD